MLWIKSFHIVFVASWFAGLAYLPRIYMNLAQETEPAAIKRLLLMARKLFRFMTIIAVPALGCGLWLWLVVGIGLEGPGNGWMHAKLSIVALLIAYHITCGKLLTAFEQGRNKRNPCWYRGLSELPVLGLLAAVLLVIFKPF
ncbi:MAG: putative membrane protein [Glomeribacter sp. 1016415]|uniref:Protoporphyrinogen IX oxidase n=1 Tax=Mycoavidus cysteinexigens TaxID=1553431 RepID=A0A2Z6EXG6_9BURK|nr:CopD family protein [Mycoavidus cysteinexigens]MCX8566414.1 putative membrane protein [Glomeribacter sp. 1016415]BBE10160.1 protoporphyrinogen ix oxidase [Mycoavidus cysteinexigens]GAM53486.1 protoporphyrinogen IX oxidase, novel form, HemJ [bacterium endosymbiont of Mortierella elongata FMR23-6]GLR00577.1 hypothetical protein GCM10007934_03880 [Mycoavidus cysteinexigens]